MRITAYECVKCGDLDDDTKERLIGIAVDFTVRSLKRDDMHLVDAYRENVIRDTTENDTKWVLSASKEASCILVMGEESDEGEEIIVGFAVIMPEVAFHVESKESNEPAEKHRLIRCISFVDGLKNGGENLMNYVVGNFCDDKTSIYGYVHSCRKSAVEFYREYARRHGGAITADNGKTAHKDEYFKETVELWNKVDGGLDIGWMILCYPREIVRVTKCSNCFISLIDGASKDSAMFSEDSDKIASLLDWSEHASRKISCSKDDDKNTIIAKVRGVLKVHNPERLVIWCNSHGKNEGEETSSMILGEEKIKGNKCTPLTDLVNLVRSLEIKNFVIFADCCNRGEEIEEKGEKAKVGRPKYNPWSFSGEIIGCSAIKGNLAFFNKNGSIFTHEFSLTFNGKWGESLNSVKNKLATIEMKYEDNGVLAKQYLISYIDDKGFKDD